MERTLTILKPDCVKKQLIGAVINQIERAGFRVVAMKKSNSAKRPPASSTASTASAPFSANWLTLCLRVPVFR